MNNIDIVGMITDRLKASEYWTAKSRIKADIITALICPQCGQASAWAYQLKPHSINCNRLNNCGARTKTLKLFSDIIPNIEIAYPQTRQDPARPATVYLKLRGFNRALDGLTYKYWQEIRKD